MKFYRGERTIDGIEVMVDDHELDPRFDIKVISPDGFEWSYEGSSPKQLALAMLADHLGDEKQALTLYQVFMEEIVANFNNEWEMTSEDIDAVLVDLYPPGFKPECVQIN